MAIKLKVLYYDIETAPLLSHHWRVYRENIGQDQILATSFMLTWSAKWRDEDVVMSDRLTSEEALAQDDSRIVAELADLIREADVVVAHNGDRFDLPELNRRVMLMDQETLGFVETIDTLKLAKKNFRMSMNRLDFLAEEMGFGRKIKTEFELWRSAYQGDERALRDMEEYNRQDVVLLEKIFNKMRPHVRRLKRLWEADHDFEFLCTNCGAEGRSNFMRRGFYRTQASTFQKWQCKNDECGRYFRERVSMKKHRGRLYPL